jgi:hypothetical protein
MKRVHEQLACLIIPIGIFICLAALGWAFMVAR